MAESGSQVQQDNLRRGVTVGQRERILCLAIRQALIIMLGALEEYLGMERSISPKRSKNVA
jgi:hypothetical protein